MSDFEHTLVLDPQGTDTVIDTVADYLAQEKYKHEDALRIRLSIDMMLLKWRDAGLDGHPCKVGLEKHMMQRTLVVTAQGVTPEIRAAIEDLDDSDDFFSQVLNTMGLDWSTIFDGDVVYAQIPLPRRHMSGMKSTLLAIMLAIVADLILLVVPQDARSFVMDSFVDPIYTTIVGALRRSWDLSSSSRWFHPSWAWAA